MVKRKQPQYTDQQISEAKELITRLLLDFNKIQGQGDTPQEQRLLSLAASYASLYRIPCKVYDTDSAKPE